mgnify:CR=1 FL=1
MFQEVLWKIVRPILMSLAVIVIWVVIGLTLLASWLKGGEPWEKK